MGEVKNDVIDARSGKDIVGSWTVRPIGVNELCSNDHGRDVYNPVTGKVGTLVDFSGDAAEVSYDGKKPGEISPVTDLYWAVAVQGAA